MSINNCSLNKKIGDLKKSGYILSNNIKRNSIGKH